MENTGFYVIPNKTQYEIGERVYLEIRKTGPTKANHVIVSLFTYQGENLKMECTLEQGVYILYSTCGKHFRKNGWISGKNRILSKD